MAAMQAENHPGYSANSQIARAAGTVMLAFIVSNLVGLIAKTMTARSFGTGIESNAFFAANRFSEILFSLVAGGALGSAFIPVFTGLLVKDEKKRAWILASSISNLVTLTLVLVSIFTALFAKQVVRFILAPGFTGVEEDLTVQLLKIQVISSVIFGLSGLVMGILNSHQHFLFPAIAPAMYQLGWIMGITLLAPTYGIFGLAWGVVIGSVLHLIIQMPSLLRLPQIHYEFSIKLGLPEVREVTRLMVPRLMGVAVVQLNFLLNTIFASYQVEGSITALGLAFPLMIMPETAIAQSIAIAALPTFAEQAAQQKMQEMRTSLSGTLRTAFLLSIPATIGLVILRRPIVSSLYKGQAFTDQSVEMVTWALFWYALGLVGHSIVEIVSRAFYALHDTKTPVAIGIGAMTLNLLFSFIFTYLFKVIGWMPLGGLALANTTATFLECVILIWIMHKRLNGLGGKKILGSIIRGIIAGGIMAAVIEWLDVRTSIPSFPWRLLITIALSIFIYGFSLWFLRTEELIQLQRWIKNRFLK